MISVIFPTINQEEMTKDCIDSIFETASGNVEVIVIDNGSVIPFVDTRVKLIRNNENIGFPKAINQGIRISTGDYICIANNDTVTTPEWDKLLISHLDNYGLVAAICNYIAGPQQVKIGYYDTKETLHEAARKRTSEYRGKSRSWFRLGMHYLTMTRDTFERIGYLDEIFTPGNFEDDDYSYRAIEAGLKLGIADDCYIHHHGSVTFKKEVPFSHRELLQRNKLILDAKWPDSRKIELQTIALGQKVNQ